MSRAELWRNKDAQDEVRSNRPLRQSSPSDVEDTGTVTAGGGSSSDTEERTKRAGKAVPTREYTGADAVLATSSGVQRHALMLGDGDTPVEAAHMLDPDTYLHAKKKLKAAVLEHYRFVFYILVYLHT